MKLKETVALVDLKVQTFDFWQSEKGGKEESTLKPDFAPKYRGERVDEIWLKFFLCVNKFMRNDHLIGLHLLLDLLRDYLVLELEIRDQLKGTNIHRFGDAESLPEKIDPINIDYQNRRATLTYIKDLAKTYDGRLRGGFPHYESRIESLNDYIAKGV